jgi:hypothetical protein
MTELQTLEHMTKDEAVQVCLNIINRLSEENELLNRKLISCKTNLTTIQNRVNHLMDSYSLT